MRVELAGGIIAGEVACGRLCYVEATGLGAERVLSPAYLLPSSTGLMSATYKHPFLKICLRSAAARARLSFDIIRPSSVEELSYPV